MYIKFVRLYARVPRTQLNDKMSFSTYGDICQEYCDCSNNACDVSLGCIEITTSACNCLHIKLLKKKIEHFYESNHKIILLLDF